MKVLLSIKPEFVKQIINGKKRFEYRKRIFKEEVEGVIIYSTMPQGKIIGEFKINNILKDSLDEIWDKTCGYSGITEDFFYEYFSGKEDGYAIEIKDFIEYEHPIDPKEFDNNFIAPQSYKYIN
jgi:predicted transcriptional regulator